MTIESITPLTVNIFLVVVDGVPLRVIPRKGETPQQAIRALFGIPT